MAAATESQDNRRMEGVMQDYEVLAGQTLYKGRPVILDGTSKYAQTNDGTTITLANGDIFAGICVETIDNSDGSDGDKDVRVFQTGSLLMEFSDTLTILDQGKKVYVNNVQDDAKVTVTQDTGNPEVCIGIIVDVFSSTKAWVRIDRYVGQVADSAAGDIDIPDGSIGTAALAASAVTTAKIAALNVTTAKIALDAIDGTLIADDAVDSEHIADGAVDEVHLADDAVGQDKLNYTKHTVTITAGTSGTATVTENAQIIGWYVTAITGTEDVKTIDISSTTLTVTLSGSDTATVEVLVLEPTA